MRTVGIIGGIAPESTVEYYRSIIKSYQEARPDGSYPSIIINSIDMTKMLGMIAANDLTGTTQYLVDEVERLARAGADFAVLASNTPHIVFDEIRRRASIPLISIVEAACEAAKGAELNRLGLFGTRFTLQANFYQDAFSRAAMTVVPPDDAEQDFIHNAYMNELVKGVFLDETRARLLSIAGRLKKDEEIGALILGGTELPLMLRDTDAQAAGLPFLDTAQIHVKKIVARLLQ